MKNQRGIGLPGSFFMLVPHIENKRTNGRTEKKNPSIVIRFGLSKRKQ